MKTEKGYILNTMDCRYAAGEEKNEERAGCI